MMSKQIAKLGNTVIVMHYVMISIVQCETYLICCRNEADPYKDEPETSPILIYRQKKPTNAEPPVNLLTESYLTPIPLWFIRGHHPVPLVSVVCQIYC